jgi:hypothetical protein
MVIIKIVESALSHCTAVDRGTVQKKAMNRCRQRLTGLQITAVLEVHWRVLATALSNGRGAVYCCHDD